MAGNNIKVVARFRPLNALEHREGSDIVVAFEGDSTVKLKNAKAVGAEADGFTFDKAFHMDTQQVEVFQFGVKEIVDDVINGYNGVSYFTDSEYGCLGEWQTVFAYGQTGSGKTFTMMGTDIEDNNLKGLIPRITEQIFQSIMSSPENLEYLVKVSFFEVYMERIRDLLAPQNDNLQVHEEKQRGVYVKGLSDFYVGSAAEVYDIMRQGSQARAVSSTNMNAESSRSHSIFVITITQRNTETGSQKHGSLYLVDLAGSEKIGKTGASGQTLEEAKKINKSLSSLGNVINALTDGKSTHIPYRDSKLTRILQESLGGNSRTTLIINCSPSSYNELETLSTLRFGMRAKSIKNKAHVNADLSPAELKGLLKKAQKDVASFAAYVAMLEVEIKAWRNGVPVDKMAWASFDKVGGALPAVPQDEAADRSTPSSRPFTPNNPLLDTLKEGVSSRPETPFVLALDKDEREDFLRRENELTDTLAEKESALTAQEKVLSELRDELKFFKEQDGSIAEDNKRMALELNEVRLQLERVQYDSKEGNITLDALREQNAELTTETEDLRRQINELRISSRSLSNEGKEKKKAEKMAVLMGNFEVNGISEKEEQIRATLRKLDEAVQDKTSLSPDDISALHEQLKDAHSMSSKQKEKLTQYQEELELANRRRDELESRLGQVEQEYEDLLEKSLHDDEAVGTDLSPQGVQELKHRLEAQYAQKQSTIAKNASDLKQQIDLKTQENRNLQITIESLKGANEELKRAFAVTAAGIEGGKNLAESAKDMERIRSVMATQLADFETMKKALMKDLQDRCEKVVELEMSLDETREQYNHVVKSSNMKAQQRKMDILTRNLDQLVSIQRQLIDQNQSLKKDTTVAEKKLFARNERIQSLETLLHAAQDRLEQQDAGFTAQMTEIQRRLKSAQENAQQKPITGAFASFGSRLAKPLRGQGSACTGNVASSSNATQGRSSWF